MAWMLRLNDVHWDWMNGRLYIVMDISQKYERKEYDWPKNIVTMWKNLFYVLKIKANTPKITLNSKIYFNFYIFISMVVFWHSSVQLTIIYLHPEFRA